MSILSSLLASPVAATDSVAASPTAAQVATALTKSSGQSTYFIARKFMQLCHWLLDLIGLGDNKTAFIWLYVFVVFFFSMAVGFVIKWVVEWVLHRIGPHLKSPFYNHLIERNFFTKTCRIFPPVIFLIFIQFTLYMHSSLASWLSRLSFIYIVIVVAIALATLCDVIWISIDERENKRHLPLNGLVQVAKLIIWLFAIIVIAALLLDKSPGALLAGLGAFAAVLMLVFKDSILGIVAGVQLAENDSLHVGDWIALPDGHANGTVSEVTLTEVKVINWDKTVSTVPPYNLITNGFKNYNNMQVSHTREINRPYFIDADSVVATTPEMLAEFAKVPLMTEWIEKKIEQEKAGKVENFNNSAGLVDGTIETNLGVFRAYMKMWLDANPAISHDDDCFVATQAQTQHGIPFLVYCFTATSAWTAYEAIMSAVFEHLAAMLHVFGLYTFENPSGRDTIIDGYLSPGKNSAPLFGLPYPMYIGSTNPMQPGIVPPSDQQPPVKPAAPPQSAPQ